MTDYNVMRAESVNERITGAVAWSGDQIRFSEGVLPSVVGMVNCSGDETEIVDCHHVAWPSCGRFDDAGVFCLGNSGEDIATSCTMYDGLLFQFRFWGRSW